MAQGDIVIFAQAKLDIGDKKYQLSTDTYMLGLVTGVLTPTENLADPRWGAGGGTNLATNEVAPGGNYVAGGLTLGAGDHWVLAGNVATFDGEDITWLQNAANPTNPVWGIIYNNTSVGNEALGFVDLGGVFDMTTGDLIVTWNAAGIFTLT